ncbi:MAG: hypothetical protein PHG77_12345 [Proteiniphilum sp.]|nr:hypothetical protein [Proteiniphilum sp.]
MTDNTSEIAGNYGQGQTITCILDEGAITPGTGIDAYGREQATYAFAAGLAEGDWVALSNDAANTYAATGGLILVEKPSNGETLVIGRIVGTPTALKKVPATAAAADTLAERLAGGFYRKARVEIVAFPIGSIKKFTVYSDGSNATVPGVGATLKLSIAGTYANHAGYLDSASANGVGIIPLHNVPAGTDGDTCSILAVVTGMLLAVT